MACKQERRTPGQYWSELASPKVLSDVVESVISALFISDNFSLDHGGGVRKFFNSTLKPFFDDHVSLQTLSHHPNKTLYEFFDATGCHNHQMLRETEEEAVLCAVIVHDVVLASWTDPVAATAVRRAASSALDALEGDPGFMNRTCDCRRKQPGKKGKNQNRVTQLGYEIDG